MPSLHQQAKKTQWQDEKLRGIWDRIQNGEQLDGWTTNYEGFIYYNGRLTLANNPDLREAILTEAHRSRFTIHPRSTNMYSDMKKQYWWKGMKQDVATFVNKCMVFQ